MEATVAEVGEKRLIAEIVRPLFDGQSAEKYLGDDCATITVPDGNRLLASTDRVPADLIPFRLGVLDFKGLGRHLAYLNLSDIAACGGVPLGLLLNMGIPPALRVTDFEAICLGFRDAALRYDCRVIGGDISGSSELSLAATSLGYCPEAEVLRRSGARPGDIVFASRPVGLTPAALWALRAKDTSLPVNSSIALREHFLQVCPMLSAGRSLAASKKCTSCMDNTDGVAQSLAELATESGVAIVIEWEKVSIPELVRQISELAGADATDFAFGAGLDFSLVGTADPTLDLGVCADKYCGGPFAIGRVEEGKGLFLERGGRKKPFMIRGWDYFTNEADLRHG
jgi:thiamine-monophosphate kinase